MTEVRVNLTRPTAAGRVAAVGVLRWSPSRRRHIDGATDEIVVPAGFTLTLAGATLADVDPTGTDWVWRIEEATAGGRVTRYVAVPDSPTALDYGDLVDVDPATLDPAAEPTAAWWAALEQAQLGVQAVPDPTDPDVLILTFNPWQLDPADDLILIMPIGA